MYYNLSIYGQNGRSIRGLVSSSAHVFGHMKLLYTPYLPHIERGALTASRSRWTRSAPLLNNGVRSGLIAGPQMLRL